MAEDDRDEISTDPHAGDNRDQPPAEGEHAVDVAELQAIKRAFERELSILADFRPLTAHMQSLHVALDMYKPVAMHLATFQRIAESSVLFTNKNLYDVISQGAVAASALRINQDAVRATAWASILARDSMPPAQLLASMSTAIGAMSLDISRFISVNASLLGNARVVMPAISFGAAAQAVKLSDWMTGPLAAALESFERTQLTARELAPVAFSTVAGASVAGALFPGRHYERSGDVVELESEMHAAGIELVRRHHPAIAAKLDGARFALRGGNPDAISQAANSLIETIDQLLRTVVDEAAAIAWCREFCPKEGIHERDGKESTTRAGKLRFLAETGGVTSTIGKGIATIVSGTMSILQQAKHDKSSEEIVRNFVLVVEGWAGAVISMSVGDESN